MHIPILPVRSRAGFTIIEVMIVLAIAAIILLIVFLAVPAAQRNSRNTAKRNEVTRIAQAYREFRTTNGTNPSTSSSHRNWILNAAGDLPSFETISIGLSNSAVGSTGDTDYAYVRAGANHSGARCNTTGTNSGGSNPRLGEIAIVFYIETFSGRQSQCMQF